MTKKDQGGIERFASAILLLESDDGEGPIERAIDLANSGQCRSVSEIIRRLPKEDRAAVEEHLAEHEARRQMILLCSEAWLATQ